MSQDTIGCKPDGLARLASVFKGGQAIPVRIEDRQWPLFKKLIGVSVCIKTAKGYSGAGVVISPTGLILTAYHNIERAGRPHVHRIRLQRKQKQMVINKTGHTVDVVWTDKRADIALLKLRHPPKTLPYAELGESQPIQAGAALYRVGVDSAGPLSSGYLMKWGRFNRIEEMEIGMPGAPGSSGGGLFDMDGRLVGIVLRAIYDSVEPSCCFAIPIHAVRRRTFRRKAVKEHLPSDED